MRPTTTQQHRTFAPGDRVEVVSGELAVRLAAGDRWPDLNVTGLHPDALRLIRTRKPQSSLKQALLEPDR